MRGDVVVLSVRTEVSGEREGEREDGQVGVAAWVDAARHEAGDEGAGGRLATELFGAGADAVGSCGAVSERRRACEGTYGR